MNPLSGRIVTLTLFSLLGTGLLSARPPGRCAGRDTTCGCAGACAQPGKSTAPVTLSEAARAALQFQLDEERMAGELYLALEAKHAAQPFRDIPRAEARHRALLENLAARAGLKTPAAPEPGRFAPAAIQSRHDTLLARGQASLVEALKVGAFVEEQNIADLRALAVTTDEPEFKAALAALERGSQHHLQAFVRQLRVQGVEYQAQVLPPDEVTRLTAAGRGGPRHPGRHHAGRRATTCTTAPRPV